MLIGDEVEVRKRDDPNDGREGKVAKITPQGVGPAAIDVAFEGGLEHGVYRALDLHPVRVRPAPGQQSATRPMESIWTRPIE